MLVPDSTYALTNPDPCEEVPVENQTPTPDHRLMGNPSHQHPQINIVDGEIYARNLVTPNKYHCYSAKISGTKRGGGHLEVFVTSLKEVNIFSTTDPNPIDPALVNGEKWRGTAYIYEEERDGRKVWRYETLIFDLEHGPVESAPYQPDRGYEVNPLLAAQ
ncbi:hypothetical protein VIN30_01100 [Adlercreutzia sp. R7]|uniref:Uncharacterized protein n=1 Tax=Adlercreutzia wanghongyangiae TaxID=3111451 RepID=A0ABU6IF29_9ACTN|nr:hypothetical protein [Adlercreutzia sp. R7]